MSRRHLSLALALAGVASLGSGAAAVAGQGEGESATPLFATMNGSNEIGQDGRRGAGDRDGFGAFAAIRDGDRLCYGLAVRNIGTPVSGGIFRGRAGVNGQPNFNLARPASGNPGSSSFCRSALGTQLDRIFGNPSGYYVDLATRRFRSDYSGGAIRGQLGTRRTGGSTNGALFAALQGSNEIGENGQRGAGDDDGFGAFAAVRDGDRLCFGVAVANIDEPTMAHIHRGNASSNGDIVVTLREPSSGDPGARAGCADVEASLLQRIFANPANYYVNVHTGGFPNGAVRGQLSLRN
jgi:CHRD domain